MKLRNIWFGFIRIQTDPNPHWADPDPDPETADPDPETTDPDPNFPARIQISGRGSTDPDPDPPNPDPDPWIRTALVSRYILVTTYLPSRAERDQGLGLGLKTSRLGGLGLEKFGLESIIQVSVSVSSGLDSRPLETSTVEWCSKLAGEDPPENFEPNPIKIH